MNFSLAVYYGLGTTSWRQLGPRLDWYMVVTREETLINDDDRMGEVQDALETTDQLHNDISRLKRLGIMTSQEGHDAHEQVDDIAETLSEKLPEE